MIWNDLLLILVNIKLKIISSSTQASLVLRKINYMTNCICYVQVMSFTRLHKGIEHRNGLWHWRSIRTRYGLRMPLRVPSSCPVKPCSISIMPASTLVFSVSTTFSWVWLLARSASTRSTVHSSIFGRKTTPSTVTVTLLPPTATMTLASYDVFGTNKRAQATLKGTLRFHIETRLFLPLLVHLLPWHLP